MKEDGNIRLKDINCKTLIHYILVNKVANCSINIKKKGISRKTCVFLLITVKIILRSMYIVFNLQQVDAFSFFFSDLHRRYMAEILPIRRKTPSNQFSH